MIFNNIMETSYFNEDSSSSSDSPLYYMRNSIGSNYDSDEENNNETSDIDVYIYKTRCNKKKQCCYIIYMTMCCIGILILLIVYT